MERETGYTRSPNKPYDHAHNARIDDDLYGRNRPSAPGKTDRSSEDGSTIPPVNRRRAPRHVHGRGQAETATTGNAPPSKSDRAHCVRERVGRDSLRLFVMTSTVPSVDSLVGYPGEVRAVSRF